MAVSALSDGAWIMLVLALLYVIESAVWIPAEATAFLSYLGRTWRVSRRGPWFANERGALAPLGPLPNSTAMICQPWLFCLAPQGVLASSTTDQDNRGGGALAWEEITHVAVEGNELWVNGTLFVQTCSPSTANCWRALILYVQSAPADLRSQEIQRRMMETFDTDGVDRRLRRLRRLAPWLWIPGTAMLLAAGTGGAALIMPPDLHWLRWAAATAFVLLWGVTTLAYWLVSTRLQDEFSARHFRWHLAMMCISPALAMRASDHLARTIVSEFHPLTVCQVACPTRDFRELARRILRELHYPLFPTSLSDDVTERAIVDWFREQQTRAVESFLARVGMSKAELLRAPQRQRDARCYCPRCDMQYTIAGGQCAACPGVELHAFASESDHLSLDYPFDSLANTRGCRGGSDRCDSVRCP